MTDTSMKILVIRNDKIGDFMLAWPAFALLKKQFPNAEVTALVPAYTADMARQCQWIDKLLIDNKPAPLLSSAIELSRRIKQNNYNLSISLFSELRTSLALFLAGIPNRVGPATKIAQVFLNNTLRQNRSSSIKPEYEYNIDLVRYYVNSLGMKPAQTPSPPFLSFDNHTQELKQQIIKKTSMTDNDTLIYIHPGTGGSAVNLSLEQYAKFATLLSEQNNIYFIITAGPEEKEHAEKLSELLTNVRHHVYHSTGNLVDFAKFVSICDIFISGSTGPLHIAAALNLKTVAFYPAKKSATSLRWQTINDADKRISFSPEKHNGEHDMETIDPYFCVREVINFYQITLT